MAVIKTNDTPDTSTNDGVRTPFVDGSSKKSDVYIFLVPSEFR
jgi:hypothetical protein